MFYLLACRGEPPTGQVGFRTEISEVVPTVAFVSWTSDIPGQGVVEFGLDGALDRSTPAGPKGTEHRLTLLGLKAGREYTIRPVVIDDEGLRGELHGLHQPGSSASRAGRPRLN